MGEATAETSVQTVTKQTDLDTFKKIFLDAHTGYISQVPGLERQADLSSFIHQQPELASAVYDSTIQTITAGYPELPNAEKLRLAKQATGIFLGIWTRRDRSTDLEVPFEDLCVLYSAEEKAQPETIDQIKYVVGEAATRLLRNPIVETEMPQIGEFDKGHTWRMPLRPALRSYGITFKDPKNPEA